jgi:hypothetical protein
MKMAHKYGKGTFLAKLADDLEAHGMLPNQAEDVMSIFVAGERDSSMSSRWMDDPDGYPPVLYNLVWGILCTYALSYIDKICPQAWFRPVFLSPSEQEAWLKENGVKRR